MSKAERRSSSNQEPAEAGSLPRDVFETFAKLAKRCISHDLYAKQFSRYMTEPSSKKAKNQPNLMSNVFAIDCEMVLTSPEGDDRTTSTLARVSLVKLASDGSNVEIIFDEFVKIPKDLIVVDRLETISGVTEEHLTSATLTQKDIVQMLRNRVDHTDIIVGHNLASDFTALDWFHPTIIDTSYFFSVRGASKFTLGLKDAVEYLLGETFQTSGESHDSIIDARYALQVASALGKRSDPFVELDELPPRFRKLISMHGFPVDVENLLERLRKYVAPKGGIIYKTIKVSDRDSGKTGSVTIEFPNEDTALQAFRALPAASEDHNEQGYLDAFGYLKKSIRIALDDETVFRAEASTYLRPKLTFTETFTCEKKHAGKIIGIKGSRINYIRKCNAAVITNEDKPPNKIVFTLRSYTKEKVSNALDMMKRAMAGDNLGID